MPLKRKKTLYTRANSVGRTEVKFSEMIPISFEISTGLQKEFPTLILFELGSIYHPAKQPQKMLSTVNVHDKTEATQISQKEEQHKERGAKNRPERNIIQNET